MPSNDEENRIPKSEPRGIGGPRKGRNMPAEKAKDFNSAIRRLAKELKSFKSIMIFALLLAIIGAILTISAPKQLTKLTDEISYGLMINKDNVQAIRDGISNNIRDEETQKKINEIIGLNFSQSTIDEIMASNDISNEDKEIFKKNIEKMNDEIERAKAVDDDSYRFDSVKFILSNPESVLRQLLKDSVYDDIRYSVDDKIVLIQSLSGIYDSRLEEIQIPESFKNVVFKEFEVNGTKISADDQYMFVKAFCSIKDQNDAFQVYGKIMELPDHLRNIVEPKMDTERIKTITIILTIMYICSSLFSYIQSIEMAKVSNNFAKDLRSRISKKINKLPLKYFDRHQIGDTLSRVTNDVDTIAQSMNQSLGTLVTAITLLIGSIIMMLTTNVILAATAMASSLLGFWGTSFILKRSQKYFVSRQIELGKLNGHIEEIFSGLNVVKVYNGRKSNYIRSFSP